MALTVTLAPARNPVPLITTDVGRAVEPVDGASPSRWARRARWRSRWAQRVAPVSALTGTVRRRHWTRSRTPTATLSDGRSSSWHFPFYQEAGTRRENLKGAIGPDFGLTLSIARSTRICFPPLLSACEESSFNVIYSSPALLIEPAGSEPTHARGTVLGVYRKMPDDNWKAFRAIGFTV